MTAENKRIVRRYYDDVWNRWDLKLADQLLSPDVRFRGSLGLTKTGVDGFKKYMELVRAAFPDFHNSIKELIAEGDKVVAKLTYWGTHRGTLMDVPATGRTVTYTGVAIFQITEGKIAEAWVLGDLHSLKKQLTGEMLG